MEHPKGRGGQTRPGLSSVLRTGPRKCPEVSAIFLTIQAKLALHLNTLLFVGLHKMMLQLLSGGDTAYLVALLWCFAACPHVPGLWGACAGGLPGPSPIPVV